MSSNFTSRRFYQSSRNGRNDDSSRTENMPPARSTPQRDGVLTDHRTPPGSPAVTTEKIYRALMNLTREMQEGRRKQAEERQSMEAKISDLTEEVFHLRQRVEETTRDDDVVPPTGKRRKKAKSPHLSEMVRRLHNSNEDDKKYEGKEGLNSPHNLAVTTFLVKEIAAIGEHPSDMIRTACVGYYETIRRNYTLSLPENKEKKEKEKKEKRLRSRRKRLLDVRSEVVQTEEEEGIWAGVTQELMSDEEDSSSNGMAVWLVKPPVFRSQQLSDLCSALQTRLEADPKYLAANRKPRLRVEGTQSDRDLPRVYDPDRAAVHFTPGSAPRPAVRPCLTTISANNNNRSSTSNRTPPPRRPTGRSLAFQSEDSPSRALEGYNVASFVDEDFLSDMDDNSLTPL